MILLDVFLMLSIVRYSLLLREVRGKGLIENDITDIFLIGQYGFDGTLRPLSHFSRIFASNIVSWRAVLTSARINHDIKTQGQRTRIVQRYSVLFLLETM